MTFPVVEIFCPECKEPMTLVNKPEIEDCTHLNGYDQIIDYHYRCDSNERKSEMSKLRTDCWCNISDKKLITVFRILIPKLNLDNYNESVATTATVNMINIEKQMRNDGIKFHESEPITNLLLNIPTGEISLEEIEKKAELVRKKYPDMTKYNLRFMRAGEMAIIANPLSDEDAYTFLKNVAEMINPKKIDLPKEEYFNQLDDKTKSFMNDCLDIIINEDSLD